MHADCTGRLARLLGSGIGSAEVEAEEAGAGSALVLMGSIVLRRIALRSQRVRRMEQSTEEVTEATGRPTFRAGAPATEVANPVDIEVHSGECRPCAVAEVGHYVVVVGKDE